MIIYKRKIHRELYEDLRDYSYIVVYPRVSSVSSTEDLDYPWEFHWSWEYDQWVHTPFKGHVSVDMERLANEEAEAFTQEVLTQCEAWQKYFTEQEIILKRMLEGLYGDV